MSHTVEDFALGDNAMRYSLFVPKLYNYCLSLGFQRDRMMPSRAFCSDESQGYPVILMMQHFGTFPFDHGRVGGMVATDRHGPHAHHGEDLVIVQASHVGYDPAGDRFGVYPRPRVTGRGFGDTCGKICGVLQWYRTEYAHARDNIVLGTIDNEPAVFIDNDLLNPDRRSGLFPRLDRLIAGGPLKVLSTAKGFAASAELVGHVPVQLWGTGKTAIGDRLAADMFSFRREPVEGPEGHDQLEATLLPAMPALVASARPALDAARYHTQAEFDRTYRSILRAPDYRGRNLLFVAGLNVDVAPPDGMPFPLTKFVPWACYLQRRDGTAAVLEQDELVAALRRQPVANASQMSFDAAIGRMAEAEGIGLPL